MWTRLKRAGAFIAIVWAVAASFVAFELAVLFGVDLALANPGATGSLMLPNAISQSTSCSVESGQGSAASAVAEARAAAWLLGLKVGNRAQVGQWLSNPAGSRAQAQHDAFREFLRGTDAEAAQLATYLGVPPPDVFVPRNLAEANIEFVTSVEADATRTARMIAAAHAVDACYLYKLGAYWGYAMMVRMALPGERSVYAIEIEYYARRARLPEELWLPVIDQMPTDATSKEVEADMTQRMDALTDYLRRAPSSER